MCLFESHVKPQINLVCNSYQKQDGKFYSKTLIKYYIVARNKRLNVYKKQGEGIALENATAKRPIRCCSNAMCKINDFFLQTSKKALIHAVPEITEVPEVPGTMTIIDQILRSEATHYKSIDIDDSRYNLYCRRFHKTMASFARKYKIKVPLPRTGIISPDSLMYLMAYPALLDLHNHLHPNKKGIQDKPLFRRVSKIPSMISRCLLKPTFKQAIRQLMRRDNRRLMKAIYRSMQITGSYLTPLLIARTFRDHLPIDYIYEILENEFVMKQFDKNRELFRSSLTFERSQKDSPRINRLSRYHELIKLFPPQRWKQIFQNTDLNIERELNWLLDIPALIETAQRNRLRIPTSYDSIADLHDQLVQLNNEHYRRQDAVDAVAGAYVGAHLARTILPVIIDLPIRFDDFTDEFNGSIWDFVCPKDSKTLEDWGLNLKNCLGSYARGIVDGKMIIGVFKNKKLTYAIEAVQLKEERCVHQFYGSCNTPPKAEDEDAIIQSLVTHHIITDKVRGYRANQFQNIFQNPF